MQIRVTQKNRTLYQGSSLEFVKVKPEETTLASHLKLSLKVMKGFEMTGRGMTNSSHTNLKRASMSQSTQVILKALWARWNMTLT